MSASERSPDPGLQEAFGLTAEEYAALLGDGSDWEARVTQICELSWSLVGHLDAAERESFFRSEVPMGLPADSPYAPRRVPLEVAAEPGGLEQVVTAARHEVSRRIRAAKVASGAPENK